MRPSTIEVAMRRFIYLPFALAITSCAPDERMPLSDCDYGLYWAECGGNDEPVLGCDRGSGDCRWFAGGVTARGYAVADKPVLGGCSEGWPFSDFEPDGRLRERVVRQMSILSYARAERAGLDDFRVSFDHAPPFMERCSHPGCTGHAYLGVERIGEAIVVTDGVDRDIVQLEILPGATRDTWSARVYRTECRCAMDVAVYLACGVDFFSRGNPTSGTLHLNTDDLSDLDALHGRVEGMTDRGEAFTFEF